MLGALLRGKAHFKRHVAATAPFAPELLPYNADLLAYLRAERQAGRRIGLFTAADQSIADAVAGHLGLFDIARGSDMGSNLGGATKADAIEAAFGEHFAYAGDAVVDLPIFARSRSVVLVGQVDRLRRGLAPDAVVEAAFPAIPPTWRAWAAALRLHHWVKNLLVFVAVILGSSRLAEFGQAAMLFVLLGVLASATYIVNDLLDLASDRDHPSKRFRPFAAGVLRPREGVMVAGVMIAASLLGASLMLPPGCTALLLAYLVATLCYSLALKRIAMVDVTILAGLFTMRVLAGSLVVLTPVSSWLLTFSMLFFLGLAIVKRYAELRRVLMADPGGRARGYSRDDLPLLMASGIASGFSAIIIVMIYLISDQYPRSIYAQPGALWGVMPILLLWTLWIWHLAVHGRMSEDPVTFAVRDRLSLVLAGLCALIYLVARLP